MRFAGSFDSKKNVSSSFRCVLSPSPSPFHLISISQALTFDATASTAPAR